MNKITPWYTMNFATILDACEANIPMLVEIEEALKNNDNIEMQVAASVASGIATKELLNVLKNGKYQAMGTVWKEAGTYRMELFGSVACDEFTADDDIKVLSAMNSLLKLDYGTMGNYFPSFKLYAGKVYLPNERFIVSQRIVDYVTDELVVPSVTSVSSSLGLSGTLATLRAVMSLMQLALRNADFIKDYVATLPDYADPKAASEYLTKALIALNSVWQNGELYGVDDLELIEINPPVFKAPELPKPPKAKNKGVRIVDIGFMEGDKFVTLGSATITPRLRAPK